jgi:hypothetical protein
MALERSSVAMISVRCAYTTLRWSLATSSNSSRFLRMSKLCDSTLRCAFSIWRVSMPLSMTSPSFIPAIFSRRWVRSGSPKMRMRLSSIDR